MGKRVLVSITDSADGDHAGATEFTPDPYLHITVDIDGARANMQIKLDDEGIVVDVFDLNGELVGATWVLLSELALDEEDVDDLAG